MIKDGALSAGSINSERKQMSKYDDMVAARQAFYAAWTSWLVDANHNPEDAADERIATVSALDQLFSLSLRATKQMDNRG